MSVDHTHVSGTHARRPIRATDGGATPRPAGDHDPASNVDGVHGDLDVDVVHDDRRDYVRGGMTGPIRDASVASTSSGNTSQHRDTGSEAKLHVDDSQYRIIKNMLPGVDNPSPQSRRSTARYVAANVVGPRMTSPASWNAFSVTSVSSPTSTTAQVPPSGFVHSPS